MDCTASPLALRCAAGCFASSSLRSVRTNFQFAQATPSLFRVGTPKRSRPLGALCARIRAPPPPDTKNPAWQRGYSHLAEREGFEPPEGYKPSTVFKTAAFDRSATSPCKLSLRSQHQPPCGGRPESGHEREGWTARLRRLPSAALRVVPAASRPAHRARLRLGSNPRKATNLQRFSRPPHGLRGFAACPATPGRFASSSLRSVRPLCHLSIDLQIHGGEGGIRTLGTG